MQKIKLNIIYSSLKSAGLLMRFVIIILLIMMTSCGQEDITIDTIRDDTTAVADEISDETKLSDVADTPNASETGKSSETDTSSEQALHEDNLSAPEKVFVYICGAVSNEGVYELPCDSRIADAVEIAGGMTEDACSGYVNLAEKLTDGEKIYIPTVDEVESNDIKIGINEFSGITSSGSAGLSDFPASNDSSSDGRININLATKEELMTLSGIGERKADDIIAYREANGGFGAIEEITNVSGIGNTTFEKLKDKIKTD